MTEIVLKNVRHHVPLRLSSFYDLYKRFLKDHGCKWHDVAKLLSVLADLLFDVDGACSKIAGKVSNCYKIKLYKRAIYFNMITIG